MSLIALSAAAVLFGQTSVPAPQYTETEVARLEDCVFGGEDMAKCGDFSRDVDALETCAGRADLGGGEEKFLDAWSECDFAMPCMLEKPGPDDDVSLVLRNCSARGVAASKLIAARWVAEFEPRMTPDDRTLLEQVRKRMEEGLEMPTASGDPLVASARWSGAWQSYLMFLRVVQLTGKAAP